MSLLLIGIKAAVSLLFLSFSYLRRTSTISRNQKSKCFLTNFLQVPAYFLTNVEYYIYRRKREVVR